MEELEVDEAQKPDVEVDERAHDAKVHIVWVLNRVDEDEERERMVRWQ